MTLNSYRDPELRDRRSVFARHPLTTVLAVVVGAFLLLVPIGARFGRADHVVVRTAPLPGGVIDAGVFVAETATTSSLPSPTVLATTVVPITTVKPITPVPSTTGAPVVTTVTTAKRKAVATTVRKPATTAAKAKPTTTVKPTATVKPKTTTATTAVKPKPTTTTVKPKTTTTTAKTKPTVTTAKATTTTTVAPPTAYSAAQSEAVIRQVWPDDLEAQAVAIATRESSLHNVAHNYCCYGLFQINFAPHKQWLATLGVTRAEQLFDPTVNATVAYRLYLLSGWAPWGG